MDSIFLGTRKVEEALTSGKEADREKAAKETGITYPSIFLQLYQLYGFDLVYDSVPDAMHTLTLNLCKNLLVKMFDMNAPEYLDAETFKELLATFPWTPEHKQNRLPKQDITSRKLPGWKGKSPAVHHLIFLIH